MSKLTVVVGGQYGSEAKGAIAGYLAKGDTKLAAVRVAGPNAGHTVYSASGERIKLQQIPVAAVTNETARLVIAAGSEIDIDILEKEKFLLEQHKIVTYSRLLVDRSATVIDSAHAVEELGGSDKEHGSAGITKDIGSTGKGVGAARAARIMRKARLYGGDDDTADFLRGWLVNGFNVMIEGTQGYGLGLHAGRYPFCTSSDCRAVDFCSMAGVSPWQYTRSGLNLDVWVVLRTFPIRVAGNSGPMYKEITWDELSCRLGKKIEPERTTVTNKVRRIDEWDSNLARSAVLANGGRTCKIALTFLDYVFPELEGATGDDALEERHWQWIRYMESEIGASIYLLGTGPNSIIDLRNVEDD